MPDYQIDTSKIKDAGKSNNLTKDILRGLIADTRGLLEARQMQRDAKTKKDKMIADEAHRQRIASVQERTLQLNEDKEARQAKDEQERQRIADEKLKLEQDTAAAEEAKLKAQDELKTEYARMHDEFFELETEYNQAKRLMDGEENNTEVQQLRNRLTKIGTWLKRNSKAAGYPEFARFDKILESDEEARKQAETTAEQEAMNEKTMTAINDVDIFPDPKQRTRLAKLHEADPSMPLSELIALSKEVEPEQDNTEKIREEKLNIWNTNKDAIIKEHGEGIWQQVATDIKYSEFPEKVDTNKYLQKPDTEKPSKEDNPYLKAGQDVYEAELALGKSPAMAEEARINAIKESMTEGQDEESATALERAVDNIMKYIEDPEIKKYAISAGPKTTSSRKVISNYIALAEQAALGNTGEVLEILGDIWTDSAAKTDKSAPNRFADAIIFTNMRDKLQELEDMGVETGRVSQKYLDALTSGDFGAAARAFGFEAVGADLTEAQTRKFAEVEAYIKREFATFLNRISGTAASDTERQNLVAISPNLFMTKGVNVGIIDGAIDYLRDREMALFTENSDENFATKVMAQKGWGDITLMNETSEGKQQASDNRLKAAARLAVEADISEDQFVADAQDKPIWKDKTEEELRQLYQDAQGQKEE